MRLFVCARFLLLLAACESRKNWAPPALEQEDFVQWHPVPADLSASRVAEALGVAQLNANEATLPWDALTRPTVINDAYAFFGGTQKLNGTLPALVVPGAAPCSVACFAAYHAREVGTVTTALEFARSAISSFEGAEPDTTRCTAVVMWMINPTGYELVWRLNAMQRKNARGVDLNRNFPSAAPHKLSYDPTSNLYAGTAPFSEWETRVAEQVRRATSPERVYLLHSHGRVVLAHQDPRQKRAASELARYLSQHTRQPYGSKGSPNFGTHMEYAAAQEEDRAMPAEVLTVELGTDFAALGLGNRLELKRAGRALWHHAGAAPCVRSHVADAAAKAGLLFANGVQDGAPTCENSMCWAIAARVMLRTALCASSFEGGSTTSRFGYSWCSHKSIAAVPATYGFEYERLCAIGRSLVSRARENMQKAADRAAEEERSPLQPAPRVTVLENTYSEDDQRAARSFVLARLKAGDVVATTVASDLLGESAGEARGRRRRAGSVDHVALIVGYEVSLPEASLRFTMWDMGSKPLSVPVLGIGPLTNIYYTLTSPN